jgi:CRISPR-associated endonuclease Csy4
MTHYLDIHLLPDPEFPAHHLLSAMYGKLHRALVRLDADSIGLSFPGYDLQAMRLGQQLRIVGSISALTNLQALDWLGGMRDHVTVAKIGEVPAGAPHRTLRRVQAKSSPERLRRRQMKRHGIDEATARERIPDSAAETLRLPFVQLASTSTGQSFRLYLRLGDVEPAPVAGRFNAYGLSTTATLPHF